MRYSLGDYLMVAFVVTMIVLLAAAALMAAIAVTP